MPLIPHLAHECCEKINKKFYWPKYDPSLLKEESCKIVIQVNGKKKRYIRDANKFERNIYY